MVLQVPGDVTRLRDDVRTKAKENNIRAIIDDQGHYFSHSCEKRPFSLSVNGAQTRVLHACVKNFFFFQLHKNEDHKAFGNEQIFKNVIQQIINSYENGITLTIDSHEERVYFV